MVILLAKCNVSYRGIIKKSKSKSKDGLYGTLR